MNKMNFKGFRRAGAALLLSGMVLAAPGLASAQETGIQSCNTNADCALVSNSCNDTCGFVPIATANLPALQSSYQARCGKPMDSTGVMCKMNPPLNPACINNRCTIDYPYANNAGPKDYKGATASKKSRKAASSKSNAYDMGVAGAAPVAAATGNVPAVAMPTQKSQATPPEAVPVTGVAPQAAYPVAAPMAAAPKAYQGTAAVAPQAASTTSAMAPQTAPVAPAAMPTAAAPMPATVPTPGAAPVTTQRAPALPGASSVAAPLPMPSANNANLSGSRPAGAPLEYVPRENDPAPDQTTRRAAATGGERSNFGPVGTVIPKDGTPALKPQAPAGSVPIPPSDLKPAPTFVPPPGAAIPVSADDPGAPPPPGTTLIKGDDGKLGMDASGAMAVPASTKPVYGTTNQ